MASSGISLLQYSSACLPWAPHPRLGSGLIPYPGFPLCVSISVYPTFDASSMQEPMGPPKFFGVSLPACHGLWTPADLHILATTDALVLPSVHVKTLGVRNKLISKLYQHFRARGHPYGLQDSLCTPHLLCSLHSVELRHRRNTRYGWVATPSPTGTLTPQDTPSFPGARTNGHRRRHVERACM